MEGCSVFDLGDHKHNHQIFQDVIDLMADFKFSETAFNVSKEQLERDHRNALIKSEELNGTLKGMCSDNLMLLFQGFNGRRSGFIKLETYSLSFV